MNKNNLKQTNNSNHSINNYEISLNNSKNINNFSIWQKYINWNKKYSKDQNSTRKLLKRCSFQFINDPTLKDNKDYLTIWIDYTMLMCKEDPLNAFLLLKEKGIGLKEARFYLVWAGHALERNNVKLAIQVMKEGINNNATPLNLLKIQCKKVELGVISKNSLKSKSHPKTIHNLKNEKIIKENVFCNILKLNEIGQIEEIRSLDEKYKYDISKNENKENEYIDFNKHIIDDKMVGKDEIKEDDITLVNEKLLPEEDDMSDFLKSEDDQDEYPKFDSTESDEDISKQIKKRELIAQQEYNIGEAMKENNYENDTMIAPTRSISINVSENMNSTCLPNRLVLDSTNQNNQTTEMTTDTFIKAKVNFLGHKKTKLEK